MKVLLLYKRISTLTLVVLGIICYVVIFAIGCNKTEPTLKPTDSTEKDTLEPPIISVDSLLGTWWCCMYGDGDSIKDLFAQSRTMVNITFINDSVIRYNIGANFNAGILHYRISGDRFLFKYIFSDTQNEEYYSYETFGYGRKLSCSSSFLYVGGQLHIDSIPTIPVYRDLTFTRFDTTNRHHTPPEYLGDWILKSPYDDYYGDSLPYLCTITPDSILFPTCSWLNSFYYYRYCNDTIIYINQAREVETDITYMYLNQDGNLVIGCIFPPITTALLQPYLEIKLRRP